MSSTSVASQLCSMRLRNSSVSLPCSSMVERMVSFRLASSHNLSFLSLISPICTSSSPPVALFWYRLMKGMVAPRPVEIMYCLLDAGNLQGCGNHFIE